MLINWFQSTHSPMTSSSGSGGPSSKLQEAAVNQLILKCCTNLLEAGVIKCMESDQKEFKVSHKGD